MGKLESIGGATRYSYRNASDAPKIMGASPYGGWTAVRDAILGVSTFTGNVATRHGENYEDAAIEAFKKQFELAGSSQVRRMSGEYAATLDFLSDDESIIGEIKCPYQGKASKIWKSVMDYADPSHYLFQLHQQLLCVPSAKFAYLFVYDAESGESCYCETTRSEAAIAGLKAAWDAFYLWMATDQPDPNDGWIQASQTWCDKAAEYAAITKKIKDAEKDQAALKQELLLLGEGEKVKGAGLTLVKSVRVGNVDYKKIPELKGIDLDQYRAASTEVWTLK